jgi:hypothetical protein
MRGKPIEDERLEHCSVCNQPLRIQEINRIQHDEDKMRRFAGAVLKRTTGREFDPTPVTFEGNEFFPLRNPDRPEESVYLYFSRRVSTSKINVFERSTWPVLVIHTSGAYEHVHLDLAVIGHVGFAYVLAALREKKTRDRFADDCRAALDKLQRTKQERVLRTARQSRELLRTGTDMTGGKYEAATFAVLRSMFPHTMKWGGAYRPDGFCSLVYSESNDLGDLQKWNWSYDSKYSQRSGGYGFNAGEFRKAFDYISGLAKQKDLQVAGNRLNAHVIVSNALSEDRMKGAAQFLWCEHRLGKKLPGFKLVFMMEDFLVTLYDRVLADDQFGKRWGYLSQRLAWHMTQEESDRYVLLAKAQADELADWVIQKPAIESTVDLAKLQEGLDETMSGK